MTVGAQTSSPINLIPVNTWHNCCPNQKIRPYKDCNEISGSNAKSSDNYGKRPGKHTKEPSWKTTDYTSRK